LWGRDDENARFVALRRMWRTLGPPMKMLIVGGGKFVGRAAVEAASARGHAITVFNRGKTTLEVPPGVEWIRGDRDGDLGALDGRSWDAVIDTCAYFPRQVETLLKALKGRVGHYLLVSSVSVYANFAEPGNDESSPRHAPIDGAQEKVTPETYGPFKVMCENSALEWGPASTLLIRPGIIVGPHDPTGRFSYWVGRIALGGEMLVPGSPDDPLQVIDVRDLAAWMVKLAEENTAGKFNAVGPRHPLTWSGMIETATLALGAHLEPTWVGDEFIEEKNAGGPSQLPLYVPQASAEVRNIFRVSGKLAFENGLKLRDLGETIVDTRHWLHGTNAADAKAVGLSRDLEEQLLAAWRERAG
jgi:2'-hydroxyisoflavone reductase